MGHGTKRNEKRPGTCFPSVDQVDFTEGPVMSDDLPKIKATREFDSLRTMHGADLVQMIGYYDDACGTG